MRLFPHRNRIGWWLMIVLAHWACTDINEQSIDPIERRRMDDIIIEDFLKFNNLSAQKTPSGIYYITEKIGTGNLPIFGDTIIFHYTGMVISSRVAHYEIGKIYGDVFSTSIYSAKPMRLSVGQVYNTPFNLPQAWNEMVRMMRKGERTTFILPSELAYGRLGVRGIVPPYAIVVFDVEMIDIIPAF